MHPFYHDDLLVHIVNAHVAAKQRVPSCGVFFFQSLLDIARFEVDY